QELPPFSEWRDSAACTFAARLLGNLGASRFSQFLHARAWRANRTDPLAAYFRASVIYGNLGPLRTLRFLEKLPPFPEADAETRASMLGLRMRILARFKDSTRAEKYWNEAL